MARLVVTSQTLGGLAFELGTHWVTIGRAATNDFQLLLASVSGRHCEVRVRGDELVVRDMRSTNGTFIKNALISEGVVKPGECLRIGEVELRFEKPAVYPTPPRISIYTSGAAGTTTANNPNAAPKVENRPPRKHQVLLVDDSMAFLETISETFEALSDQSWEIHRTASADQALAILQQHPIELAVLDINMPMLDGVQLLGVIQRRHPDVKKVILTAHASETHRAGCLANGAELFLEKPIRPDGIVPIFNLLNDLFVWGQREGFSGTLRQVGLTDLIQIECLRRSSSILEVLNPSTHGEIYIETGAIVHASAGLLTGAPALFRLLAMSNGQFRIQAFRNPGKRTIAGAWENLLLEAARLRDEDTLGPEGDDTVVMVKAVLDQPAGVPSVPLASDPLDSGIRDLGDDIVVVSTYDGHWHPVVGAKR